MPVCAVRCCRSKSGNSAISEAGEKRHFFQVKKDPDLLEKWKKALNRDDITNKHYVCDKHFPPETIVRKSVLAGPNVTIFIEVSNSSIFFQNYKII